MVLSSRRFGWFPRILVLISLAALLAGPSLPRSHAGALHERFVDLLAETPADSMVTGLVMMAETVDLPVLEERIDALQLTSRAGRHQFVVETARETAARTQAPILALLENWTAEGRVDSYRSYWVANMISVTARAEVFDRLAARPDVGDIYRNENLQLREAWDDEDRGNRAGDGNALRTLPNNLICVGVQHAWDLGYRGQGRLVGLFDSGADGNHEAFGGQWRGIQPGVNWWEAWRDPYNGTEFPVDTRDHGTHVLGIMVGEKPGGEAIGVAPEAYWMAAAATANTPFDYEKIIGCYQWATDPDGDPETIDDVPDVVNNSWGSSADCSMTIWDAIDLVEAAGIVNTIAIDNRGPNPMTVNSPESRATSETVNWGVGNVNPHEPEYPIWISSGRGPSPCDSTSIKPEVTAPGVSIYSTLPGGSYGTKTGTSMACPHTSGAVAILRQIDPDLTVDEIKWILMQTSLDRGTAGEDNDYGWGIIDIAAAVDSVRAQLPRVAPQNLAVAVVADTASLTWERPDPIHPSNPLLNYRLYRAPLEEPFPLEPVAEVTDSSAVVTHVDAGLAFDRYHYVVTARYEIGESDPSNEVEANVFPNDPPENVTASVSVDTVTVEWLRPGSIHEENPLESYRLFRAPVGEEFGVDPLAVVTDTSATVAYVDTALAVGTYHYALTADYLYNESNLSEEAVAAIHPFGPPRNLNHTVAADTVVLHWERPDTIAPENPLELYRVYRAPLGEPFPDTALAAVTDTSAVVSYPDPDVPYAAYEYAVTALYQSTESDTTNHATVPLSTWSTPPADLMTEVSVDTVRLEWSQPAPVHPDNPLGLYRIYRAVDEEPFPGDPLAEVSDSSETVSFLDPDLPPATYRYVVSAVYDTGESDPSEEGIGIVYPTDPPAGLSVVPEQGNAALQWSRPDQVDRDNPLLSYRIYRAPLEEPFGDEPIAEIVDTTEVVSFVDSLVPFDDLHWIVTAVYPTAESPPSNEAILEEIAWMNPPQDLAAGLAADTVSLDWERPGPVHPDNPLTLYRVYRAEVGEAFGAPIAEVVDSSGTVVHEDPGVPFADLRYRVTALYAAAESDSSNEVQILESMWLTPPRDLAASLAADSVRLDWDRPAPIHPDTPPLSFRVYRANVGEAFEDPIAEIPDTSAAPAWVDSGVPFADHRYVVTAVYAPAESDSSDEVQVLEAMWQTPPRDPTASVSVDSVDVRWVEPAPLHPDHLPSLYRVYRAPTGEAFPVDPLAEVPAGTDPLAHLDLEVEPGDYDYAVTALYPAVESDTSAHAPATIYPRTPPQDLMAAVAADSVLLSWERPDPIHPENPLAAYRIYRAPEEDPFGDVPIAELSDTAATVAFADSGVAFGNWKYRVTGMYANAESDPSNEAAVPEELWINAPADLAAEVAADSVSLAWTAPAPTHPDQPPLAYRIFRAPPGEPFPVDPIAETADSVLAYVDAGVPLGDHAYAVTASYASAESDTSNHAVVFEEIWSGPARNLTAEVAVDTVGLLWERPAPRHPDNPPLVYRVFRAPLGEGFPIDPIGTVSDTVDPPAYTDYDVPVGDYAYTIQAVYAAVEADTSNHATASVYPRRPPRDLGAEVAADSVSLHWAVPDTVHPENPILTYRIYRAKLGEPFGDDPIAETADTAYVDAGVPFDSLQYAVTALYPNTESDPSNLAALPEEIWGTPPDGLAASVDADTIRLAWTRPAPVHPENALLLYRIYRAPLGDPFPVEPIAELSDPGETPAFVDSGVPYESLQYAVTALYESAESDTSNHAAVLEEIWNGPPTALAREVAADSVRPSGGVRSGCIRRTRWPPTGSTAPPGRIRSAGTRSTRPPTRRRWSSPTTSEFRSIRCATRSPRSTPREKATPPTMRWSTRRSGSLPRRI
ncbi:MAG: S8 family serine peptidase [Candidatus Eisenbacteria bacterium]|nr:S8 family serine peptidase [Candidatus Latescibacterota bacterium]MBD3300820.1 S8 family serine peptidase [Candidatus Eisenbacteria bacterium]